MQRTKVLQNTMLTTALLPVSSNGIKPQFNNKQITEHTDGWSYEFLPARRLGNINSAMILFAGPKVLSTVILELTEKRLLTKRRKSQSHNKKLRKKIEELNTKAEASAVTLTRQSWNLMWDCMQGRSGVSSTWKLLRALTDPEGTSTTARNRTCELRYRIGGPDEPIVKRLANKYLCLDPPDYATRWNE
ncbi:hypothetical protein HPB47_012414 [Ixodes persulcatus]|uniref:Uncharacterized protein n=1 Tax=Ixodes persulcatus TaxID=34615 RepID=A0AC60NTX6_IXOPE|nr:hypothetical protein HPB47_012414 [Ixodes persulcatus]